MSFINLSKVTQALTDQLKNDSELIAIDAIIERGQYINMNPDRCISAPWIGVYKATAVYDPRTLGRNSQSWDGLISIRVIVQAAHGEDGSICEDRLEEWLAKVLDAAWSDSTWKGEIDMLTNLAVDYTYNETDSKTLIFQQATLTIEARLSTG